MKHRALSIVLAISMVLSLAALPASAVDAAPNTRSANGAEHWFYDQLRPTRENGLSENAQKIYNAMYEMYSSGHMKDGVTSYDLAPIVGQAAISSYVSKQDRTLFADFTAAKDAFDLEHPEVWYMDSSYLSFRVTHDAQGYHAWIGPGRATNYHLNGHLISDVDGKTEALERAVNEIVRGANDAVKTLSDPTEIAAAKVRYVHRQVIERISYRFEFECSSGNSDYIRTLYALVTHEGVCEAYARSMQYILTKLGVPCVLVSGMQTSDGNAEQHMWNAVQIGEKWYVVDATWDDPVKTDARGNTVKDGVDGLDGSERDTYLMVGNDVVGFNWQPAPQVSSGAMEFTYPGICSISYSDKKAVYNDKGLKVEFSSAEMEGTLAGKFTVSYNGLGAEKAASDEGVFLLIKMHMEDDDQLSFSMDQWCYAVSAIKILQDNEFFRDTDSHLEFSTPSCKYVEFALTRQKPVEYERWDQDSRLMLTYGNFSGDNSAIIAETGRLENQYSSYRAAPYVKVQTPSTTVQIATEDQHHVHIEFDDALIRPRDLGSAALEDNAKVTPQVAYYCYQQDRDGNVIPHSLEGRVNFDSDEDGVVDTVKWLYRCDDSHVHSPESCPVYGVEYDFDGSKNWSDDTTLYEFHILGLVGKTSNRLPNYWNYIVSSRSCPFAYRSQGIDWNMWGRPNLLDNPSDLDLSKLTAKGVNGSEQSLKELQEKMKIDDMNGRLMLTVEDVNAGSEKYGKMSDTLEDALDREDVDKSAIKGSSLYEINFIRLCKQTVVTDGQSVRMQVGFPKGIDPEEALSGNLIFKAYHFNRDEEGNIISVNEIPLALTPYGLVILCDSFSPFEIVALDADQASASSLTKSNNVIVATDGNGSVYVDGKKAAGEDGFIQFSRGEEHTFSIEPKQGFVVDAVSFAGKQIAVTNNSFALTYDEVVDKNDMLNVSFVPATIKAAEGGEVSVVPDMADCKHAHVRIIPAVDPTCETPGHAGGEECRDCGRVLVASTPIAALGHDYDRHGVCTVCGAKSPQLQQEEDSTPHAIRSSASSGGEVDVDETRASLGDTVNVTVSPKSGYVLEELRVTDEDGEKIPVRNRRANQYVFTMPASKVTVRAAFAPMQEAENPIVVLPYGDVPGTEWYYTSVAFVYDQGLMDGVSPTSFAPQAATTRAMLVESLYRLAGSPASGTAAFTDVPSSASYAAAVAWAADRGVVSGYGNGLFGPDDPITREQMALIFYQYAQVMGFDTLLRADLSWSDDAWNISSYALDAMRWANAQQLINGVSATSLAPKGGAVRAQTATILMNFCQNVAS